MKAPRFDEAWLAKRQAMVAGAGIASIAAPAAAKPAPVIKTKRAHSWAPQPAIPLLARDILLPWPSRELSPNGRGVWFAVADAVDKARKDAFFAARAAGWNMVPPDTLVRFEVFGYRRTKHRQDDDNLLASCKAYRDGIADALHIDDNRFRASCVVMEQLGHGVVVRLTVIEQEAS